MTRRAAVLGAVALSAVVVTVGGATVAAKWKAPESFETSQAEPDEDEPRAGPDSTRIAMMLNTMRSSDPIVCALLVDHLGNNYWGSGHDGVGRFDDAPATIQAARDSLHGRVSDPRAIALLLSTLSENDPCVRRIAAQWLGRSRVDGTQLSQRLADPSLRVRVAAAYAIGVGDELFRVTARGPLEALLRKSNGSDGAMAAWALGEMEDSASAPALRQALRSPHVGTRLASIDALARLEDAQSVKELERMLRDDANEAVRAHAARAIGEVGEASAVSSLAAALRDVSTRVQYEAVEAMEHLDDIEKAPEALVSATRSKDPKLQRLATMVLAEIGDPDTIDDLLALTSHRSRDVRLKIAEALGEIGSSKASDGLLRLLKDADPEVRRAAAESLGQIRE